MVSETSDHPRNDSVMELDDLSLNGWESVGQKEGRAEVGCWKV